MPVGDTLDVIQSRIWTARLPLEIRIAPSECRTYDKADAYLIACSRLSYLPNLLPQLLIFFAPYLIETPESLSTDSAYFVYDSIPLKWHLPIGLLYDLHVLSTQQLQPETYGKQIEPFRLTIHFSLPSNGTQLDIIPVDEKALHDAYINAVKEADFLRSGNAKPIMSLSAADSQALWTSSQQGDLTTFARIHNALLPSAGHFRNVPLRVFIPASDRDNPSRARIKVLQCQLSPNITATGATNVSQLRVKSGERPQTLGSALHSLIPALFPSRRAPLLARPLLHGAQIPMAANLEDLARKCCYADGWINIVVAMSN